MGTLPTHVHVDRDGTLDSVLIKIRDILIEGFHCMCVSVRLYVPAKQTSGKRKNMYSVQCIQ